MKKLPFILAFAALALHGCDQGKPGAAKPAAPAFIGTYKGVLPCASCAGIETTLELATDGNYTLTMLFLEVPDAKPETVRGRYTQSDDTTRIPLTPSPTLPRCGLRPAGEGDSIVNTP